MANGNGPNFESLLDESPTEVKSPSLLPEGTYTFNVKIYEPVKANSGNEGIRFPMQAVAAHEDVDPTALADCLNGDSLMDKEIPLTFWITDKSIYRLDEFHQHCGLDLEDGSTRRQRNENVVGHQVLGYVKHEESNKQPGRFFANIVKTAPVD